MLHGGVVSARNLESMVGSARRVHEQHVKFDKFGS
jgi:hypothetical protein